MRTYISLIKDISEKKECGDAFSECQACNGAIFLIEAKGCIIARLTLLLLDFFADTLIQGFLCRAHV